MWRCEVSHFSRVRCATVCFSLTFCLRRITQWMEVWEQLMCPGRIWDKTISLPVNLPSVGRTALPNWGPQPGGSEAPTYTEATCQDFQGQIGNNHVELIKTTKWSKAPKPSQRQKINLFSTWLNSQCWSKFEMKFIKFPLFLWKNPLSSSKWPPGGRSALPFSARTATATPYRV